MEQGESQSGLSLAYRVGDLLVDVARARVVRNDQEIALPKLSFELLLVLIRAAPNLVSTDLLMERIWSGLVVSPETVTQRVKLLRDSLDDDPKNPRYIAGVRGRGYRLAMEVIPLPAEPVRSSHRSSRWRWVAAATGAIVLGLAAMLWYHWSNSSPHAAPPDAVATVFAVVPFDDGGVGYGAELERQIRTRIGALPGITLVRAAGESSGLTLRGTLHDRSDGVSIDLRVDGDGVRDLWHQSLLVKAEELGTVVDVVAGAVQDIARVRGRKVEVVAPDYATLQRYLIGRSALRDRPPHFETQLRAIADDLIQRAPRFAPGYALRAIACTYEAIDHSAMLFNEEKELLCAREAVDRALQLDPQLAEAHAAAGLLATTEADLCRGAQCALTRYRESAQMSLERAIRLDPQLLEARLWLSLLFEARGELARAAEQSEAALRLDPLSPIASVDVAYSLMIRARYDEARALLEPLAKLPYANVRVTIWLMNNAFLAGRHDEELAWGEASLKLRTGERAWEFNRFIVLTVAEAFARLGHPEKARAVLRDLPEVAEPDDMEMVRERLWTWIWLDEPEQIAPYLQFQQRASAAHRGDGAASVYDRAAQQAYALGYTLIGQPQTVVGLLEPLFGNAGQPHFDPASGHEIIGLLCLAWAYHETGKLERAHVTANAALRMLADLKSQGVDNSYNAMLRALGYSLADRMEESRAELQRTAVLGWPDPPYVTRDPRWSRALRDPRIRELVHREVRPVSRPAPPHLPAGNK